MLSFPQIAGLCLPVHLRSPLIKLCRFIIAPHTNPMNYLFFPLLFPPILVGEIKSISFYLFNAMAHASTKSYFPAQYSLIYENTSTNKTNVGQHLRRELINARLSIGFIIKSWGLVVGVSLTFPEQATISDHKPPSEATHDKWPPDFPYIKPARINLDCFLGAGIDVFGFGVKNMPSLMFSCDFYESS